MQQQLSVWGNDGVVDFPVLVQFLLKYLDKSSILACRAVSKPWQNSVDQFLQNYCANPDNFFKLNIHDKNFERELQLINNRFIFKTMWDVLNFLRTLNIKTKGPRVEYNPFITRYVEIHMESDNPDYSKRVGDINEIKKLVESYAHHIFHLVVHIPKRLQLNSSLLAKILSSEVFPKMKRVQIIKLTSSSALSYAEIKARGESWSGCVFELFKQPLTTLKYLDIDCLLPHFILEALLWNYGEFIRGLRCRSKVFSWPRVPIEYLTQFTPYITSLHVSHVDSNEIVARIARTGWQLRKLQFSECSEQFPAVEIGEAAFQQWEGLQAVVFWVGNGDEVDNQPERLVIRRV